MNCYYSTTKYSGLTNERPNLLLSRDSQNEHRRVLIIFITENDGTIHRLHVRVCLEERERGEGDGGASQSSKLEMHSGWMTLAIVQILSR